MIHKSSTLSEDIYISVKRKIENGEYSTDSPIPTENMFADEFGVARGTVRNALKLLEDEGLIRRVRSRGTFVNDWAKNFSVRHRFGVIRRGSAGAEHPQNYVIPGIESASARAGAELVYYDSEFLRESSLKALKANFSRLGITGVMWTEGGFTGKETLVKMLQQAGIPVVLPHISTYSTYLATGFAAIRYEGKEAFKLALKHLADQGHTRVGLLSFPVSIQEKIRGYSINEYKALLEELGLSADDSLIKLTDFDKKQIAAAVEEMMSLRCPPTAIMGMSDFWCLYVYDALKKLSLRIPDDVAVMGFCAYPGGSLLEPPLSTVDLAYAESGRTAVKLLLEADKWFYATEKTAPPDIVMPFKLIVRESTKIKRLEREFAYA